MGRVMTFFQITLLEAGIYLRLRAQRGCESRKLSETESFYRMRFLRVWYSQIPEGVRDQDLLEAECF
ncbi:hypothetical protein J6590_077846 [Homalodisca vitripennis]|nr:hypothetical protein J6590_077846 [Homalodisca vitripennis]